MNYKVFIGYSSEDNDKAQYIHDCLARIVEIIPYKAEIYPDYGEDFKKRIENELDNSHFIVVLITSNGIRSQWVNQEIGYAYALKKRPRSPLLRELPHIIPISESQTELKGFITKDSIDILFLDKFPSWEIVITDIILKIRNYIPRGLEEGTLHFRVTCSNCVDTKGFPFEFIAPMGDWETIKKALQLNRTIAHVDCPQCHTKNFLDVRTFLSLTKNETNP